MMLVATALISSICVYAMVTSLDLGRYLRLVNYKIAVARVKIGLIELH